MRKEILLSFLLALLSRNAFAQFWAEAMFPIKTHDFGTIARYAQAEFQFPVTNIYKETIIIESAVSSCKCTNVTVINPVLKTGQTGYIHVKINSHRFVGQKGATITVRISQPFPAAVELHDRVTVSPE